MVSPIHFGTFTITKSSSTTTYGTFEKVNNSRESKLQSVAYRYATGVFKACRRDALPTYCPHNYHILDAKVVPRDSYEITNWQDYYLSTLDQAAKLVCFMPTHTI